MYLFAVLLLLVLEGCIEQSDGMKDTFSITDYSSWSSILVQDFGLVSGSTITVSYQAILNGTLSGAASRSNPGIMYVVSGYNARLGWYSKAGDADLSPATIQSMCNSPAQYRVVLPTNSSMISGSFDYVVSTESDRFTVISFQCTESLISPITVQTTVVMKSPVPPKYRYNGVDSSYLPMELVFLPTMYLGLVIVYVLLLVGQVGQLLVARY